MLRYIIKSYECGMCGFTSRIESRVNKHVNEFPNCAFTEQSFMYLGKQKKSDGVKKMNKK